ncbi:hypothetical protein WUBG_03097 [Wuchereria bancrofti]|uniref:Uncharacterized protein n=1 Tax=Wuchereria bancrofti TaxID=6293 RepID=J9EUZ0_WUCBA|nr:hypothetical protein WUBG_03097 [Wuchereria bancrofti]
MFFKKWETKGEKNRGISLEFSFIGSSGEKRQFSMEQNFRNETEKVSAFMSSEIICHLGKLRSVLQQPHQAGPVFSTLVWFTADFDKPSPRICHVKFLLLHPFFFNDHSLFASNTNYSLPLGAVTFRRLGNFLWNKLEQE